MPSDDGGVSSGGAGSTVFVAVGSSVAVGGSIVGVSVGGIGVAVGGSGVAVGGSIVGVAVGGTGVGVGTSGVAVGGTEVGVSVGGTGVGVFVGGIGVAVGGTGVSVGGTGVAVGGTAVAVAVAVGAGSLDDVTCWKLKVVPASTAKSSVATRITSRCVAMVVPLGQVAGMTKLITKLPAASLGAEA